MTTSRPTAQEKQQFGRERFLQRIARFQRHPVSDEKGMNQEAALEHVLSKAGISRQDLAEVRRKSSEYTRAVGESFIASLQRKQLSGMSYFTKSPLFASDYDWASKGRSIRMKGVGIHSWQFGAEDSLQPTPPPPQYLPPNAFFQDCHVHGAGIGCGVNWPWVTDDGTRGGSCDIEYQFSLTPATTDNYMFSSLVEFGGTYYLVADDGFFDSKEAWCKVSCYLGVNQPLPMPVQISNEITVNEVQAFTPVVDLFYEDGQNILDGGGTGGSTKLNLSVLLFANNPVEISVIISVDAWARGDGSVADLNLARPTGALVCGGVMIN